MQFVLQPQLGEVLARLEDPALPEVLLLGSYGSGTSPDSGMFVEPEDRLDDSSDLQES